MKLKTIKQQQGIATVLIVLLVGVALTASTLGVIYSVKSTQNKQVTSHATSNAQSAAWALAEAVRKYLELETTDLAQLRADIDNANAGGTGFPLPISLDGALSHLSQSKITLNSHSTVDGRIQLDLSINAIDTVSKATSQLNLVFVVQPSAPPTVCQDPGGSQFTGKTIGDSLDMKFDGASDSIKVDGSYGNDTQAAALTGVSSIQVTGEIFLEGTGNGDTIEELRANGKVFYGQSGRVLNIYSGDDIETKFESNAIVINAHAAGNVIWGAYAGEATGLIEAGIPIAGDGPRADKLGTTDINKANGIGTIIARGDVTFAEIGSITNVYSRDSISFTSSKNLNNSVAIDSINCAGGGATQLVAGNGITNCAGVTDATSLANQIAASALIPPVSTYQPVVLKRSLIADADKYKQATNYFFTYDEDTSEMRVTVRNVEGLEHEGEYVLFNNLNVEPKILNGLKPAGGAEPTTNVFSLCKSNGDTNPCIEFTPNVRNLTEPGFQPTDINGNVITANTLTGTENEDGIIEVAVPDGVWSISQSTLNLAPGIMYFDRDLRISPMSEARLVNGFLSAGDINVTGSAGTMFALNGVPATVLCGNKKPLATFNPADDSIVVSPTTDELFPEQNGIYPYPQNFCEDETTKKRYSLDPDDPNSATVQEYIGEFSLLAGQQNDPLTVTDPPTQPTYQGGDIYMQVSSSIYGRVIAGNTVELINGTNVHIYGSIGSEARADGKSLAENNLNGTINVHTSYLDNLESVTDGNPNNPNNCDNPNSSGNAGSADATLLWSRYL